MDPAPRVALVVLFAAVLAACAGAPGAGTRTTTLPANVTRSVPVATASDAATADTDAAVSTVAVAGDAGPDTAPAQDAGSAVATGDAGAADGSAADGGVVEARPAGRMYRGVSEDDLLTAMATRPVLRVLERFSSTTLVYHLDLGDGLEIAFKPDRVGQEGWWRHEVDAFRLARVLGVEGRVPPVVTRRIPLAALGRWGRDAALVTSGRRHDSVVGAAIFWAPVLRNAQLHTPESVRRWTSWLDPQRPVPAEHSELARDIAVVLAFDYIEANTDRWNSGNVRVDDANHIVMRDNNGAWFLTALERDQYRDNIRRVPRSFADALARATPEVLRDELARDPGTLTEGPHLSRQHLAAYEVRRQRLLAHIQRLVRRHGEAAVYAWP